MSIATDLQNQMRSIVQGNLITDRVLQEALDTITVKGDGLLQTGRHNWVRKQISSLNDMNNWDGYGMQIHLTNAVEQRGIACQSEKQLLSDKSDVDIVYADPDGSEVRIECVSTLEPLSYWQESEEYDDGIIIKSATYDGQGEADLIRRVQHKIRVKCAKSGKDEYGQTIYRQPTKFPLPIQDCLQIVAVDVTKGVGINPDFEDLALMCRGNAGLHPLYQRNVVGLFETAPNSGTQLSNECEGNKIFAAKIHAVLFLVDRSNFRSPLNPIYDGCIIYNPNWKIISEPQKKALLRLGNEVLSDLVPIWLRPSILQREH